jgi:integral membrane protein (TIGR01906 family)
MWVFSKVFSFFLYFSLLFLILLFPFLKFSLFLTATQSFRDPLTSQTHLEKRTARRLNQNVVRFIQGKEALDEAFTRMERSHMEDVKRLFTQANTLLSLSMSFLLGSLFILPWWKGAGATLYRCMIWSGGTVLVLGAVFLVLIFLDFQKCFIFFHEVLFPQGNWSFSPHSLLIQLYPKPFFMAMSQVLFLAIMSLSFSVWFIGYSLKRGLFREIKNLMFD